MFYMAPNSATKSTSSSSSVMPGSDVVSPDDGPSSSTSGLSSRKRTNTEENHGNHVGLMNVAEKLPRISDPPDWSDSEETVVLTPSMPGCASGMMNDNNREVVIVQDQVLGSTDDELRKCQEKIAQLQRENEEIRADRDSLLRDITFGRSENVLAREQLQHELLEILEAEMGCVICNDVYMEPSVIECGHIFCFHCISNWLSQPNGRNCPTCRVNVTKPLKVLGLEGYICRLYSTFSPEVQQDRNQVLVERRVENESREEHRLRRAAELRAQAERELERMIQAVQRLERDTNNGRDGHDRVIVPPRGLGPGTISLAEALARSRRRIALQQLPQQQQQQASSSSQQQQQPMPQPGSSNNNNNPNPTVSSSNVPVIQPHPVPAMVRPRAGINFSISLDRPGPSSSSSNNAGPSSSSSLGSTSLAGNSITSAPRFGSAHNLLLQQSPDGRAYPVFRIGQFNTVRAHPSSSTAQVHVTNSNNSLRMQDCSCGRNTAGNPTNNPGQSPYHRCHHHHQQQDTQQNTSAANPPTAVNHPCRVQLISGGRIQPITAPMSNSRSTMVTPSQMGTPVQNQSTNNSDRMQAAPILHHHHHRYLQQQQMWNNPNIGVGGAGGTNNINNNNDNNNPLNLANEGMNNNNNFGNDGRNAAVGNNLRANSNDDHNYWHGFHF